jgi:hypothetical protein
MLVARRRVSLPRQKQQEEQDSGSRDRELCHPDGGTVRKQLRHRQLLPAENRTTPARGRKAPDQPRANVEDETICTVTTVHHRR